MKGIGKLEYVIINTQDSAKAVPFWSSVLGREIGEQSYPYTDLVEEGSPTVSIQQLEGAQEKGSSIHVDIRVEDLDAAIGQVVDLGGVLIEMKQENEWRWAIMADPDGNIFCLVTS